MELCNSSILSNNEEIEPGHQTASPQSRRKPSGICSAGVCDGNSCRDPIRVYHRVLDVPSKRPVTVVAYHGAEFITTHELNDAAIHWSRSRVYKRLYKYARQFMLTCADRQVAKVLNNPTAAFVTLIRLEDVKPTLIAARFLPDGSVAARTEQVGPMILNIVTWESRDWVLGLELGQALTGGEWHRKRHNVRKKWSSAQFLVTCRDAAVLTVLGKSKCINLIPLDHLSDAVNLCFSRGAAQDPAVQLLIAEAALLSTQHQHTNNINSNATAPGSPAHVAPAATFASSPPPAQVPGGEADRDAKHEPMVDVATTTITTTAAAATSAASPPVSRGQSEVSTLEGSPCLLAMEEFSEEHSQSQDPTTPARGPALKAPRYSWSPPSASIPARVPVIPPVNSSAQPCLNSRSPLIEPGFNTPMRVPGSSSSSSGLPDGPPSLIRGPPAIMATPVRDSGPSSSSSSTSRSSSGGSTPLQASPDGMNRVAKLDFPPIMAAGVVKRKRGRPRKNPPTSIVRDLSWSEERETTAAAIALLSCAKSWRNQRT